ncbi:MAG TPA: hypothetical protein VN948_17320 [Terriglobales bacterium]|nr:hypothetical protein [Terriglobales bacterium]
MDKLKGREEDRTAYNMKASLGHKTLTVSLGVYAQEIAEGVGEMVERDERETLAGGPKAVRHRPSSAETLRCNYSTLRSQFGCALVAPFRNFHFPVSY